MPLGMGALSAPPQDMMKEAMDRKRAQMAQGQGQTPTPTSTSTMNQQGAVNGAAGASAPKPAAAPAPAQTFQQMSAAGQARPAPPPAAPNGMQAMGIQNPAIQQQAAQAYAPAEAYSPAAGGGVAAAWQPPNPQASGDLKTVMAQALGNPSGYGQADVQKFYNTAAQGIDDQFSQQNTALKEQMARSGLDESSIAGGRMADLNVGKRSAMEDLASKYGEQYAQDYATQRNAALGIASNVYGTDVNSADKASQLALDSDLGHGKLKVDQGQLALDSDIQHGNLAVNQGNLALDTRKQDSSDSQFEKNYGLDKSKIDNQASQYNSDHALDVRKQDTNEGQFDKNYGLDVRKQDDSNNQFDKTLDFNQKGQSWDQMYQLLNGTQGLETQTPWDAPQPDGYDPSMDPQSDQYDPTKDLYQGGY